MAEAEATVKKGMRFRSVYADSNALWEVKRSSGGGVWQCEIVNEPFEIDGRSFDGDYAGTVRPFNESNILSAHAQQKRFAQLEEDDADWFDSLKEGQIVHYNNGFSSFVRCEVVMGTADNVGGLVREENIGRTVLQPVALVGNWGAHDLPHRNPDGSIRPGFHAGKIMDGKGAWRPSTTCVYEAPDYSSRQRSVDPSTLEEIDLTVPEMTPEQAATALKWQQVNAIREAVSQGRDPDEILGAVRETVSDTQRPSL